MCEKSSPRPRPLTEEQLKDIRAQISDRVLARGTALSIVMALIGGIAGWSFSTLTKNRDQATEIEAYKTSIQVVADMSKEMTSEVNQALADAREAKKSAEISNQAAKSNLEETEKLKADWKELTNDKKLRAGLAADLALNDKFRADVATNAVDRLSQMEKRIGFLEKDLRFVSQHLQELRRPVSSNDRRLGQPWSRAVKNGEAYQEVRKTIPSNPALRK